jgi:hypothetical protein
MSFIGTVLRGDGAFVAGAFFPGLAWGVMSRTLPARLRMGDRSFSRCCLCVRNRVKTLRSSLKPARVGAQIANLVQGRLLGIFLEKLAQCSSRLLDPVSVYRHRISPRELDDEPRPSVRLMSTMKKDDN